MRARLINDRKRLLCAREVLEEGGFLQKRENYDQVKDQLRDRIQPNEIDSAGYNLLHWATFLGDEKEVRRVIQEDKVDVNSRSQYYQGSDDIHENGKMVSCRLWNATPLWIAAFHGNFGVVKALVQNNADTLLVPTQTATYGTGMFVPRDVTFTRGFAFDEAKYNGLHEIVNLLAMPRLDRYIADRTVNEREYKTTLFCGLFNCGYSRTQKLAAAQRLKAILGDEQQKSDVAILETLARNHPAVNQGELSRIYKGVLKAAKAAVPRIQNVYQQG